MKRLILNVLLPALFLMGLSMVSANMSRADDFACGRATYISEDLNQLCHENALGYPRISYLSEEPVDPNDDSEQDCGDDCNDTDEGGE